MKNRKLLCALFLLCCTVLSAQELKVESFSRLDRDLLARTAQRLDLNEEPCAVVRVFVANAKAFTFFGNVIGEVGYNPGEAIVYMTDNSRKIKISSDKFGSLEYEFPERLQKSVTYRLKLRLIEDKDKKIRTLVMPVVGLGNTTSFGAMIGVVKKHGAYLKVKYNFKSLSAEMECEDDGRIAGGGEYAWFSDETQKTRFAITGGYLHHIMKPLYLYIGAGYGEARYGWKTSDGKWAEITDHTYKGIEADLGCIYRIGNIAFSVGYQTNQFKYHEATLGVGIMF